MPSRAFLHISHDFQTQKAYSMREVEVTSVPATLRFLQVEAKAKVAKVKTEKVAKAEKAKVAKAKAKEREKAR